MHVVTLEAEIEPDSVIFLFQEMHNLLFILTLLQFDQGVVSEREVAQTDFFGSVSSQVGNAHLVTVGLHAIIIVVVRERQVQSRAGILGTTFSKLNVLDSVSDKGEGIVVTSQESVAGEALRVEVRNERGSVLTVPEGLVRKDALTEADVVSDALDDVLIESTVQDVHGTLTVLAPRDQLGDHGIVIHADLAAFLDAGVNADAATRPILHGFVVLLEEANRRQEVARGILSINAVLHRMTIDLDVVLVEL